MTHIPQELLFIIPLSAVAAVHYLAKWKKYWAPLTFIAAGSCCIVFIAGFDGYIRTSGSGGDSSGIQSMQLLFSFLAASLLAFIPVPPEWKWVRNTVAFIAGWVLTLQFSVV